MTPFELYTRLGIAHITDLQGYDHILFIIALCTTLTIKDWRKVLLLVTVFTLAHTLTLVLAVFDVVNLDETLVELGIAISITFTGLNNLTKKGQSNKGTLKVVLAGAFGLIHGLGFSRYYNMIAEGTDAWLSLSSFTLGIEIGQLLIVLVFLFIMWLLENAFNISKRDWNLLISGGVIGISLTLIAERLPQVF